MKEAKDVERLYQNYIRYQSGDKSALDEVFMEVGKKAGETKRIVDLEEEYKLSHTENVLDAGLVENEIGYRRKDRKLKVVFSFPCLNNMVRKAKYEYSKNGIFTGYENGKKINSNGYKKFHSGKYDTFELEEEIQEIVIKLFQGKLSGSNIKIVDGVSLYRNIKYYLSKEIGNYNKILCKNVPETYIDAKSGEEMSYFDQYSKLTWMKSENQISRILPYSDYLEWIKRNDVSKLFKENACNIKAVIETIMNCKETFITGKDGDTELGLMRLITQEMLHEIICLRHGINIGQENISRDLEFIEQRLLDHLFYSLNYRIGKAPESSEIYEKESERFLYESGKETYVKIFGRTGYKLYNLSIIFKSNKDFDGYFDELKKYEEAVMDIVSLKRGKMMYDMVNLLSDSDCDLVDDWQTTILNVANTIIEYYQSVEIEYQNNELIKYKIKSFSDWEQRFWEAELDNMILKIQLFSSENVKKPVRYNINREKLIIYCGYMNYYFCDEEKEICFVLPKNRRVISRSNKNHEIFLYRTV